MYDRSDLYLIEQESENPRSRITCPNCESYLVERQRDNFFVSGSGTYTCLDCLNTFSVGPMDDDPTIPF